MSSEQRFSVAKLAVAEIVAGTTTFVDLSAIRPPRGISPLSYRVPQLVRELSSNLELDTGFPKLVTACEALTTSKYSTYHTNEN
jgi:hypothetical protein